MPRPKLNPTSEQRELVETLTSLGVPHEQIAKEIGIRSPKTLRTHFRDELDLGALRANVKVGATLFRMATSGNHPTVSIFWAKSRMGWSDRPKEESVPIPAPPPIVVTTVSRAVA